MKAAQRENAQIALFADPGLDRATQVEFYQHEMDWANRLILGDSLMAITSLLERERMAGQAQQAHATFRPADFDEPDGGREPHPSS